MLNQRGFAFIIGLLFIALLLVILGIGGFKFYKRNFVPLPVKNSSGQTVSYDQVASRELTGGDCSGAGPVELFPPMRLDQIGYILPYGLLEGGHVTPVDHQYYVGLDFHARRDTYDVIGPADGTLISVTHRGSAINTPIGSTNNPSSDEYRLTIVHTCSFITTLDLLTSLSNELKAKLPSSFDPQQGWRGSIKVRRGDLLGHIGGQTLDVFVWDLSRPLTGFINPDQYTKAEAWKIFTAPVSEYLDPSVKDQVIAKYVRTAKPIDGKIDYDIDGKLIGNWFLQDSGGYPGNLGHPGLGYWVGHLSFVPDFIDPSVFNISIGNYSVLKSTTPNLQDQANREISGAAQFITTTNSPDPAIVGPSTDPVKYELVQKGYYKSDGTLWNEFNFATYVKARPIGNVEATVLAQLIDKRILKFELFRGKSADQVSGFDRDAEIYTR